MEPFDNNQFEVKAVSSKRKIVTPSTNVYLNPALDLLANDDPMCNTAMEIVPNKKRKQTSCDIAAFENSALDLGISKTAVNEFLVRELNNVRQNFKVDVNADIKLKTNPIFANVCLSNTGGDTIETINIDRSIEGNIESEPVYNTTIQNTMETSNISPRDISEIDSGISVLEQNLNPEVKNGVNISNVTRIDSNVTNQIFINNTSNLSLSFIDRLALDSPNASNQSLYLDDDLNESNIMEIKTITIITKKKRIPQTKNTNPFLEPNMEIDNTVNQNPFLDLNLKPELEYNEEVLNRPVENQIPVINNLIPRKLFAGDTNSTISTVNESSINIDSQNEYENIDGYRSESPIYENIGEEDECKFNKQSKILGCDVSKFNALDIININKTSNQANNSNESNDSKKDIKRQIFKVSNKLSKKVLKSLKKTFKTEKPDNNVSLNPYEVPRKAPKQKTGAKESGIENAGLNLDNSDEIEIEEIQDEEHEYETIKTIRNTRLNMNVTPLRERDNDADFSHSKANTPGKKVRFDSTLNREKVITGNSFDCDIQSPGFDTKIDKYHDELENCINERKYLQQNM